MTVGDWTNQTSLILKFTLLDASPVDTLTPEVEIKPLGTAFSGTGLRTGSAVASSGTPVQGVGHGDGAHERVPVSLAGPRARRRRADQRLGQLRRQRGDRARRGRRHRPADRLDRRGRRQRVDAARAP